MPQSLVTMALVCRVAEYKDNDYVLTMVSPTLGKISAIARGARKQGSGLFASVQQFCYGEYVLYNKSDRISVTKADVRERFFSITEDFLRFSAGQMVLQLLADLAQAGEDCEDLFKLSYYLLSHICYGKENVYDLSLYYLLQLLKNQGVSPHSTRCAFCGDSTFSGAVFHKKYGALCQNCKKKYGGKPISALSLEAIFRMLRLDEKNLEKLLLPEEVRDELCTILPAYFEEQMEQKYNCLTFLYEKLN